MDIGFFIKNIIRKYNILLITIFLLSCIIYFFINKNYDWYGIKEKEINYLDSLYYTIVTFSTIGYGDITPQSNRAKIITIIIIFGLLLNIYIQIDR